MSPHPWRYWWPMRGEAIADAHDNASAPLRDADLVARDIAERDWARSDYWTEEKLVLVDPFGNCREFDIEVESVPHFNVRGRLATQAPGVAQPKGDE